ncbi:MAG TPA: PLP-dependent transferase, partial [Thermohalobaculum sp.]|nr:PLP-dependent transferase [Thermohalobaculum sp.]
MKPSTKAIRPDPAARDPRALTTPIYETTTFVFESAAEVRAYAEGASDKYLYSRYSNPTVAAVEQRIAALEGAEGALLFASGQAATTTALLALAEAGDEIVCSAAIYGGTVHLLEDVLAKFGVRARF